MKRAVSRARKDILTVDRDRLAEVCRTAVEALRLRKGFFHDFERELPQHNLPDEIEEGLVSAEGRRRAANYLFVEAYLERVARSPVIVKRCAQAWGNEDRRWIFEPREVVKRSPDDVQPYFITGGEFNLGLQNGGGKSRIPRHQEFYENMVRIAKKFNGDTRRLVSRRTAESSRRLLSSFRGIDTIGNLFIIYLADRDIAHVKDPENTYPKVDTWKAGIPLNVGGVRIAPSREWVRREPLIDVLEPVYREICETEEMPVGELDRALWLIGTLGCRENNARYCRRECPVYDKCEANTMKDSSKGIYVVHDSQGRRIDTRVHERIRVARDMIADLFESKA